MDLEKQNLSVIATNDRPLRRAGTACVSERFVGRRVVLKDIDRPAEPLIVEILETHARTLCVFIPNTNVSFDLRRIGDWLFECSVGGRNFEFDARTLKETLS